VASQEAAAGARHSDVSDPDGEPPSFDTSTAHPARVYNYWLGGKDNYEAVAPASRIVYVENDPIVLAHARALLTSTSEGASEYIEADVRDPDTIVREADATDRFNARRVASQFTPRTREEIAMFFDGLEIIDPGLVPVTHRRALAGPRQAQSVVGCLGRRPVS
jgi:S-adenosyl methyltransferase